MYQTTDSFLFKINDEVVFVQKSIVGKFSVIQRKYTESNKYYQRFSSVFLDKLARI